MSAYMKYRLLHREEMSLSCWESQQNVRDGATSLEHSASRDLSCLELHPTRDDKVPI